MKKKNAIESVGVMCTFRNLIDTSDEMRKVDGAQKEQMINGRFRSLRVFFELNQKCV